MNDEVVGEKDGHDKQNILPGCYDFGQEIARIAVAQVCQSIGFDSFCESALDSLADISIRYISDLGKNSKFYASLSRRTQCNVFDILRNLEDFAPSQSTSKIHSHCVVDCDAIRELKKFVERTEEVPFAQPLPKFPVIREPKLIPSFPKLGEVPVSKHIPSWLPAFPDPHTYLQTTVWNDRVTDPRDDKIELARQHRKAERSLLNLQQRILASRLVVPSDSLEANKLDNPFIAQPMEEDVSLVNLPPNLLHKNLEEEDAPTLLKTFAPAIEAMTDRMDYESRSTPSKRPPIFLEFKSSKKLSGEPVDMMIQSMASRKDLFFGRDAGKDDKKRRVEFILRQSMDNQMELP